MTYTIEAPVTEFTGVVAGVHFADGKAETDNEAAVAYFRRQGYTVDEQGGAPEPETPTSPTAQADDQDTDPEQAAPAPQAEETAGRSSARGRTSKTAKTKEA